MNSKSKITGEPISEETNNSYLFIKTGIRYEKLNIADLMFVKTEGKYIGLIFKDGKRLLRISLVNFLKETIQINLVRVHKCFAINTEFITSHATKEVMILDYKIPIGRQYKEFWQKYLIGKDNDKK
ncbi:LytTR family transcriptional regulator [Taibaiella lutea]|uniref:LytTR family transcriptional regulator n=1 Tax=Taibaiella lutea TaxID=2608001 RepID=A0A5M6CBY3_9BACT|nr:LytTR family DNA-binding domain-containing protein [Taibaiella lutea]KAA5532637.1 LytTR family transcriptional regulator [Taibaiella lutea]